MIIAEKPENETDRLAKLHEYQILDTPAELEFDDLTRLAADICGTSIALISLLDAERQWFKSTVGLDVSETPRDVAFCSHAILGNDLFEVPDTLKDARFHDNPLVTGAPEIRFYAGMPLSTAGGLNLGTLCVIDRMPRELSGQQRDSLARLGRMLIGQLELRLAKRKLQEKLDNLEKAEAHSKLLETCLNRVSDIVMITEAEPQEAPGPRILYVNDAFEKLTGYTRDEVIGKSPRLLKGPKTDPVESGRIRDALKCWRKVEAVVLNYKKNGEEFWNEMTITPVADPTGWFTNWVSIERDVTERKRAEEQMAASKKALEDLKSALDEHAIVAVTDARGKITYVNDKFCAISKYTRDELIGKDHRIVNSGYHAKEVIRELWETISSGRVWKGKLKNKARDGSSYWVDTTIVPFLGDDGKPFQYIAIRTDITEQVALAKQIESANRELTDFAYVVSHDLKAPLRGISTLAEWIAEDYADKIDDDGKTQLRLLTSRVSRLNALIDGILAYSRAGRTREAEVPVNLDAVAKNVAEMLAPPANIRFTFEDPLPTVRIEPTKAQQLFQNLFSNAMKFMDKPEGAIRVKCAAEDGIWHFSVADNGMGIDPKYFGKIFDLFETLAPKDSIEGTGVGLALVKKIVEISEGRIWVESTLGAGATFHFTLPRIEQI